MVEATLVLLRVLWAIRVGQQGPGSSIQPQSNLRLLAAILDPEVPVPALLLGPRANGVAGAGPQLIGKTGDDPQ